MRRIKNGFILPSAAYAVARKKICGFMESRKTPEIGDLVYGTVSYIGEYCSLENKQGRIHAINNGSRAIFALGNRYAPDYYEGTIPAELPQRLDLLARSGIVGVMQCKSSLIGDPTQIAVHGYVCDSTGKIVNTRNCSVINPKATQKTPNRSKLILNIGTSMNSGKSTSAAACCWALSTMGHTVRGSKVTGTAGLKDILLMADNGAFPVADFTYLGYPSTYLLDEAELVNIFNMLDLKYANKPKNYWVAELADGLLQRETAMLLESEDVRCRIHKLIFSAHDAFSAIGGLSVLKERFELVPDAISGVCSSSPLGIRELREFTDIPVFDGVQRDLNQIASILL